MKKHFMYALVVLLVSVQSVQSQHFFSEMLKNGQGQSPQSVLSLINVYKSQDSLAYVRTWSSSGTVLLSTTITNLVTSQSQSVLPVSASSSGSDTVSFGGLQANAPYTVVFRVFDGFTLDSISLIDSTLGGVPSPATLALSLITTSQTTASLKLEWNQNGGGVVFVTYEDSSSGGSWNFLSAKVFAVPNSGIDTLTVSLSPGTTKYYRAYGYNQMFPLGSDTTSVVAVSTLPLNALPPIIGQMSVSQITSGGGTLHIPVSADSVGGVIFIEVTSNGTTFTLPNVTFLGFDSIYSVSITNCDPLSLVLVTATLYSYNPQWPTHTDTVSFVTASGPFEISILGCYPTGTNSIGVDVEYSSGGVQSNTLYAYAFDPFDHTTALGYSQMYNVGIGQQTTFTIPITTGLFSGTTYDIKVYQFNNSLGSVESSGYCTSTTFGVTSIEEEYVPLKKRIFYDSHSESISNQFGYTFSLYDVEGRLVHVGNEVSFSMNQFPPSLYFLSIGGEGIKFFK